LLPRDTGLQRERPPRPFGGGRPFRSARPFAAWQDRPAGHGLNDDGVGWGSPVAGEPTVRRRGSSRADRVLMPAPGNSLPLSHCSFRMANGNWRMANGNWRRSSSKKCRLAY
jgi:hypothetical protein